MLYLSSQKFVLDLAMTYEGFLFACLFSNAKSRSLANNNLQDKIPAAGKSYNMEHRPSETLPLQCHSSPPPGVTSGVPRRPTSFQRSPAAGIQHSQVLHVTFQSELLPATSAAAEVSSSAVTSSIPPCWVFCLFFLTASTATCSEILSRNLLPVIV